MIALIALQLLCLEDVGPITDASPDVIAPGMSDVVVSGDTTFDPVDDSVGSAVDDVADEPDACVEPGPGELGSPCNASTDCATNLCVDTSVGRRCSIICVDGCTPPFGCVPSATAGLKVCVPPFGGFCDGASGAEFSAPDAGGMGGGDEGIVLTPPDFGSFDVSSGGGGFGSTGGGGVFVGPEPPSGGCRMSNGPQDEGPLVLPFALLIALLSLRMARARVEPRGPDTPSVE